MKNQILEAEDAKLTALLRQSRPTAPMLPPGFQQTVWRRIQRAETSSPAFGRLVWVDQLADRLLRPRWALTGITTVVVVGVLAGTLSGTTTAKKAAQERYLVAVAPSQVR